MSVLLLLNFFPPVFAKDKPKSCSCENTPKRFSLARAQTTHLVKTQSTGNEANMVTIPAGWFMMGGDNKEAKRDEFPKHKVYINSFLMDKTTVTNADFQKFVNKTHYITTAEIKPDWEQLKKQLPPNTKKPDDKFLVPASLVFTPPSHSVSLQDYSQWWTWMPGADWRHPRGPASHIEGKSHPVVHVSWDDANAYCKSLNKRLPTEAEWEWAARGGLTNNIYPWGNEAIDEGKVKANTWQGEFPNNNTLRDKFYYTSPVASFAANGYGLYDMAGNVWEWVADWYRPDYYAAFNGEEAKGPKGPSSSYDPHEPNMPKRVLRGGSYLCNASYCSGYRVSARMKSSPDTSMQHIGFRCVK